MNAKGTSTLLIPVAIHDAMLAHCLKEAPLECCGILGGVSLEARSIHPLRNIDASETHYNADPMDLIRATRWLRENGAEFVAIYHSHPRWPAIPSKADLRENYYEGVPRIIVSLLEAEPVVRVWRLDPESYEEIAWQIVA